MRPASDLCHRVGYLNQGSATAEQHQVLSEHPPNPSRPRSTAQHGAAAVANLAGRPGCPNAPELRIPSCTPVVDERCWVQAPPPPPSRRLANGQPPCTSWTNAASGAVAHVLLPPLWLSHVSPLYPWSGILFGEDEPTEGNFQFPGCRCPAPHFPRPAGPSRGVPPPLHLGLPGQRSNSSGLL